MGRKLNKYEELKTIENVFERDPSMKGRWRESFFKNDRDIVLELACGKGDYTNGLAALFPEKNFIGMDLKGNRIWSAARIGRINELKNVAFIRDQIDQIDEYFEDGEVSEIWITFADPYLKKSKAKKRLTSSKFLLLYQKILPPGGVMHLKTDSDVLYEFSKVSIVEFGCEIIDDHPDIYAEGVTHKTHYIQTHYEKMHLKIGRIIKYLSWRFT